MVSLISAGLKLEFAAGDPAGGLSRKSWNKVSEKHIYESLEVGHIAHFA